MPQPDPFSNAFAPMPSGLWGDEYRAAGGVTFDDVFRWQEEQAAEQARLQALAEEEWRTEQAAAAERARQQQYAQASEQFIDWPTYQQRAGGNPAETYASYVQQVLPAQLAAMGYTREEIADELKMFVGMVHQPAPDYGFFGNLGESMSQGARSGTRGVGAAIDIMQGDLDELAQTVVAAAGDQNTTAPLRRFQEVMGAPEGERDWWEATKAGASAVWDTPVGALNFLAQQLSQSYPVLGAGLAAGLAGLPLGGVGGAVTGALGVGTGSTALEAGASIIERITKEAQARGVNLQDPEAVRRMLDTPGLYDELKSAAIAKGLTVGSTDALLAAMSLGLGSLAGKAALAGRGGRAMGYGAAGVASDALGSAGGEWLSQQTAGDTTDWREIVGEAIGELGSAAVTTSAGAGYSLLRGRNPLLPDVLPEQGDLPGGEPDIPLLPGPLPAERQLPPPSQVAIILGDASQQAEQTVAETNPLFATLDRVSPGWRENATAEVTEPGTPQIDLDDAAQVRQFIQQELRAAGVNTGGFTRSIQADELIGMVVNAPADSKREAIAEAIDALEPTDLTFAAGMAKALLNLTKTLPAPNAQQIVEAATVQPNRALVDVINQITGVRTRDERLAAEQAWYDHFVATRDEFAAMRQARQQRREQEADAAWERVQLESRVTAMNEQYDRQPVDQAALDAASQQLDRILERASARTPTSREKLQKLRLRAQLLLEESVDAYNRGLGERADAGGGGVGVVGRGGPDTGGGGVGYLTAGGRSSTASAITPLQYRYLNERGGRRDVDFSIGARLIAEELGIDNTEVVSTVAQAMAHYVVGFPLTALTPVAEVPYSHPVDLMPGERTQYNADPTQYLEAGTPGSRFRRRDATLDEVTRRERGERAAALVEQRRARRTANALKRPLRPGELIPTADIVAGFRGPVPAGEGGAQAAQGSRRGLRAGVAQARVDQSEAARDAARELAARSGAAIAAEPDAAQSDQGISRVGLGGRYPMQERPATRGTVDTGYSVRNPLKGRTQTEMERDADDRRADRYARTLEARERRAAAKAAAKAEKKGKKQGLSRAMRKEARLESEAMYEELYPDRSYEEDLGEIMDAVEESRSEDSREVRPDARGLSEDDQANLRGSTDDVLAYLEKVAATPLQRFIAGQLRDLGLELPPIKFGPIEGGKVSGRYEHARGMLGRMQYAILIDPEYAGLHTVLHEIIHAATLRLIAEPQTVAQKQAVAQLEQLMAYVMQVRPDLAEMAGKPGPGYGLKNLQEFVAVALSDTYFQQQLAEIPVPKHPNFSVLQALRRLILKLFGIDPKSETSNVLQEVFAATPQLMSREQITASGVRALDAYRQYGIPVHALSSATRSADSLVSPPPAAPIPRAPSTAIIGTNPGGQRSFIAYQKKPGADEYTLYQTTPQEPRGDPQTKVVRLTREQVERTIRNAGSRVIPPTAGRTNQQPSNTASKLAGWDADGNLRAMAYEQKDGTWTYFESDSDVRTDPRARVVKQLSKAQAQQYIAAQGRRPAPPRGGNTLRAGGAPTPVTYSAANWARLLLQDTEATLKQIGEAQRRAGTPAAQRIDVQATQRNSRVKAKYDKVKRQYIQPAVKAADDVARRFNRTQSEIEEILANLHVTERMPHKIRQVQRGQWSTQQAMQNKIADLNRKERAAQAFLRQLNTTNPQLLRMIKQELSPKIKAMTDNTVDMMAAYGLIDLQTAQDIKDAYDWYVPLQTGDRTALNRAATGASATSDRPFSRMVEQAYLAIARGEQNALRVEVANLVRQNQLLEQTDGGTRVPLQMGATQRVWFDPVTNTLNEGTDTHVFDDNSIDIYENGQRTRLTIHDPTLLEALHPYKGEQRQTIMTYALALWARVTHLIAIGKTSLNPTFPLFNGIRDVLAANINMPPGVSRLRFNMALLSPETWTSALTAIGQDLVGREVTGRIGTAAEEGAFITHRAFLGGVDEISRDIDSMFGPVNLTSPGGLKRGAERVRARQKKWASKTFDVLSVIAQISETVPRYAVYKAALDSGLSQQEAAFAAKTASINFENRGLINPSNYWIFGNAKLQGLRALYETAQRAGTGKAVFGLLGIVALGAIAGALGVKLSDEDKDGLSKYFKIPDYRKDAMVVWKEGAWGVPIPQEIAPFYVLGNALAEGMAGRRASEVTSRIFTAALNNVWMGNVPQQDVLGHRADVIDFAFRAMMPSIAQPMIAYTTNKNTFGSDVVPGLKEKQARGQPRHEMGGPAEDKLAVNVAKGLNTATGGTVDLAPQQLRLFNDFFNPTSELYGVLRDTIVGRDSKYVGDEPNPWTRRFAANATQFADQNQFDELLSKATRAEYLAKEHGISTLSLDDQALARSAATLKKIKSDADNLFKGQKLMTPERRQALNERKLDMYLTGIKRYNDLRDRMVPAR